MSSFENATRGPARPWSQIDRVEGDLSRAVAADGLTPSHMAGAEQLLRDASASGALTFDLDSRNALQDMIQYWSALLSAASGRNVAAPALREYDPTTEVPGPLRSTEALAAVSPGGLLAALDEEAKVSDSYVRGALIEGTSSEPHKIRDCHLQNSRLARGRWENVEFTGGCQWSATRFSSFEFRHVIADNLIADDVLLDDVDMTDCEFESGADFSSAILIDRVTVRFGSFKGAVFRRAKLVDSVQSLDDSRRELFDMSRPAAIKFEHVNLSHASFERALLCGVSFAGCDLTGVSFEDAIIDGVDFSGATLTGTDFSSLRRMPTWRFDPIGPVGAILDPQLTVWLASSEGA